MAKSNLLPSIVKASPIDVQDTQYKGVWNATTNTPTIVSGVGSTGNYYLVTVAGNTTIDGQSGWQVGDQIKYSSNKWEKIAAATDRVITVANKVGIVTLTTTDIVGLQDELDLKPNKDIVTTSINGLMSSTDKVKLNGIIAEATKNSTDSFLLNRTNHTGKQSADTLNDGLTNRLFLDADKTKLNGIATQATKNATDSFLLSRTNHTGTQSADTIVDGSVNRVLTSDDKLKLDGISRGATANLSDDYLLNRANHTGTQPADTIIDSATKVIMTTAERSKLASISIGSGGSQTVTTAKHVFYSAVGDTQVVIPGGYGVDGVFDVFFNGSRLEEWTANDGSTVKFPVVNTNDLVPGETTVEIVVKLGSVVNNGYLLNRVNHVGTQSADTIIDGTNNKVFTAAEKTKLVGLTSGGTGGGTVVTKQVFNSVVGDTFVTIAGGYTVGNVLDVFFNGLRIEGWDATNGTTVTFPVITTDDIISPDTTVEIVVKLGQLSAQDTMFLSRANHTGTQSADTIVDGTTNKVFTSVDKNKIDATRQVATRTEMKALDTAITTLAFLSENGRQGLFKWTSGNFSTQLTADTAEGVYIKASAIATTAGAWVRQFDAGLDVSWFGALPTATDNTAAFIAAAALNTQIYIPDGNFNINATTTNFDTLRAMFNRCTGTGVINLFLATGIYNTALAYGFVNTLPVNVIIRGENLTGSLNAANVTFAGNALNYTAAITFTTLPAGIAVGQLLSLVATVVEDKRTSLCFLTGANKITNISGNVVTVAIPYHGTVTAKMPNIVGSVSFTGAWRLNKSIINYTGARTPFYVQNPFARINLTDIGFTGPYSPGNFVNTSAITVGWIDETNHYVKDQLRISGVGVSGYAHAFLGQGAYSYLGDFRASNCLSAVFARRQSKLYALSIYATCSSGDGINIVDNSELFATGEVLSCGNSGRGLWTYSGKVNIPSVAYFGYNLGAGAYVKAGAVLVCGPTSCSFRNNNIGWGEENASYQLDFTISEYNLGTGYEFGQGDGMAPNSISRYNENGYYLLIGASALIDAVEAYGNSQNGLAVSEASVARVKNANLHDNADSGINLAGNSHVRGDNILLNNNGRYGVEAIINSSARLPAVSGNGGTLGKYSYDSTSPGTTW